jgi:hypothetical protein
MIRIKNLKNKTNSEIEQAFPSNSDGKCYVFLVSNSYAQEHGMGSNITYFKDIMLVEK